MVLDNRDLDLGQQEFPSIDLTGLCCHRAINCQVADSLGEQEEEKDGEELEEEKEKDEQGGDIQGQRESFFQ